MGFDTYPVLLGQVGAATGAGGAHAAVTHRATAVVALAPLGDAAQYLGHLLGFGVAQIMHLGVALVASHIQLTNHGAQAGTGLRVTAQNDRVGALVGNQFGAAGKLFGRGIGIQPLNDAHHIQRRSVLQRQHFKVFH